MFSAWDATSCRERFRSIASWASAFDISCVTILLIVFELTAARFGLTAVLSLFFVIGSGSAGAISALTQTQFFDLLAITFSTGLVALLIYYYGLQRVAASRAAILELAWPLSAVIIGWLFLHQGLNPTQALGAIILLVTTTGLVKDKNVLI